MSIRKVKRKKYTRYVVDEVAGYSSDGKIDRVRVTCKSMAEAKAKQAEIRTTREAQNSKSGQITLSAYIRGSFRLDGLSPTSRDTYERDIRLHILPILGNIQVRDISRAYVQRMVDRCKTKKVAQKALGTLRTILNRAVADGIISTNPASFAGYVMPPPGKPRDNGLVIQSFNEMRPVLDAIDDYADECVELLAVTGLLMGLRPQERYGIDWDDFDWHERTVHIQRAYTAASKAEGTNILKDPKTPLSNRIIPISDEAYTRLYKFYHGQTGAMILGANKERITPSTARKRWNRFLRSYDVPPVTLENMRHSFATSYLAAGGSIEILSRILGHSDINTTYRRYVRPDLSGMRRELENIHV
jgi:integrase